MAMINQFLNPLYPVACELPLGLPLFSLQFEVYFLTLIDIVPVTVVETVCLCCECYRHKGRLVLITTL